MENNPGYRKNRHPRSRPPRVGESVFMLGFQTERPKTIHGLLNVEQCLSKNNELQRYFGAMDENFILKPFLSLLRRFFCEGKLRPAHLPKWVTGTVAILALVYI